AQLLGKHRRRARLMRLLDSGSGRAEDAGLTTDVEAALLADLHNPYLYPELERDDGRFLALFNAAIDPVGPAPVRLSDGGVTPFDRLSATSLSRVAGPLITV